MRKVFVSVFGILCLFMFFGCAHPAKRVILVEEDLYNVTVDGQQIVKNQIEKLKQNWTGDGIQQDDISVVTSTPDEDPEDVRRRINYNDDLDGIFIVGFVPAWYIQEGGGLYTDIFYSFPGLNYQNGGLTGNTARTVGVGRITTSFGVGGPGSVKPRAQKTVRYLEKLNNYWENDPQFEGNVNALLYIDTPFGRDAGMNGTQQRTDEEELLNAFDREELVSVFDPDLNTDITNEADYKSHLNNSEGYEWVLLGVHGGTTIQSFATNTSGSAGGTMNIPKYIDLDPKVRFFHFQSCRNGEYRTNNDPQQNLCNEILVSTSHTLGLLCNSESVWLDHIGQFYKHLNYGIPLGRSLAERNKSIIHETMQSGGQIGNLSNLMSPHIFGDPFLRIQWRPAIQSIIAYDPNVSSLEKAHVQIAAKSADLNDSEVSSFNRAIRFYKTLYNRKNVTSVIVNALDSDGRTIQLQGNSSFSTNDKYGVVLFNAQPGETQLSYRVKLTFADGSETRWSASCGTFTQSSQIVECD